MSETKEKDRVQIEETDLVFENNSKKLYRGLEYTGSDSAKTNIPLESRALVTEQQLNYLAKDIRDYLDEENYVSYNKWDNRTTTERETAINNIFGDGVLEGIISRLEQNLTENGNGVTTYGSGSMKELEDALKNAKHVIILTDEAKVDEYGGIPILSEYFQGLASSDVIYRDETCRNVYEENGGSSNWVANYKNFLLTHPSPQNKMDNSESLERLKNKWRFADFYRVAYQNGMSQKNPYLNGLYGTQEPSSIPAFCEYIALPYNTCVPDLLANLEVGDILYKPTTGELYQVKKDNSKTIANTLMGIDYQGGTYQANTIYGVWSDNSYYIDNVEKLSSHQGYTCFEGEAKIKEFIHDNTPFTPPSGSNYTISRPNWYYLDENGNATDKAHAVHTTKNGKEIYKMSSSHDYGGLLIQHYVDGENNAKDDNDECKFNKDNYVDDNQNLYLFMGIKQVNNEDLYITTQNDIPTTNGKHTPRFNPEVVKTQGTPINVESVTYNTNRYTSFKTVLNDNSPRIYYNIAELSDSHKKEIAAHYPFGAMAIYCEPIGIYKPNSLWKFIGDRLFSGGIEFPKDSYQKVLSTPQSTADISVGDFIFNPYSTELRQVSRKLCASEVINSNTYLTKPVIGYMHNEDDGIERANGSYLRGATIHYLIPKENSVIDESRHIPALPDFIEYIKQNLDNTSYRLNLQEGNKVYVTEWENALNELKTKRVFNTAEDNTKMVFNTLYLLPQNTLNNVNRTTNEIRFLQLNSFIPGDYVFDIKDNKCDVYQITCAPYLYDIFDAERIGLTSLSDEFAIQKLFVNYMYSKWNYPKFENAKVSDIFLGNVLLTLIKREQRGTEKYYCLGSNQNYQYQFVYSDQSEERHYFEFSNIDEWFKIFLEDFVGSNYNDVAAYAKENEATYLTELRQRLLTNYSCPIAVNGILINSFYFSGNGESSEEVPQSIIDELNRLEQQKAGFSDLTNLQTAIISTINNRNYYSKPQTGISEGDLTTQLQNKLNNAYIKPVVGIPESDLAISVQNKLNKPSLHTLENYETITYDELSETYLLETTNLNASNKKYFKDDYVVSPQFGNIFKLNSNMGDTPVVVLTKTLPNNIFEFKWTDYFGPDVHGYQILINEIPQRNEVSYLNDAKEILLNGQQLILKFYDGPLNGCTIKGGSIVEYSTDNFAILFNLYYHNLGGSGSEAGILYWYTHPIECYNEFIIRCNMPSLIITEFT